jgi:hypothetical protein
VRAVRTTVADFLGQRLRQLALLLPKDFVKDPFISVIFVRKVVYSLKEGSDAL